MSVFTEEEVRKIRAAIAYIDSKPWEEHMHDLKEAGYDPDRFFKFVVERHRKK